MFRVLGGLRRRFSTAGPNLRRLIQEKQEKMGIKDDGLRLTLFALNHFYGKAMTVLKWQVIITCGFVYV